MITIKDIAREAGVSTSLVSFVMNNQLKGNKHYRVSAATERKVLDVIERYGYQPNEMARTLRSGEARVIGVIISDIANRFYAEIARGIADWAYKNDYIAIFGNTDEKACKLAETISLFNSKGVKNYIIVPCEGSEKEIEDLEKAGIPHVLIDRDFPELDSSSVTLDNAGASRLLALELIGKGCRNIEMISYKTGLSNIRDREEGFLKGLVENGSGPGRIHHPDYGDYEQILEIIRGAAANDTDGLIFTTYRMALLGRRAMHSCGEDFVRNCRVACFNNYEELQIFDRSIVYAKQPVDQISSEAIRLLLAQIDDKNGPTEKVILKPEIFK